KKVTDHFEKKPLAERSVNLLDHRLPATGDIEDALESDLKSKVQLTRSAKRKSPEATNQSIVDPYASLPSDAPAIDEDYSGWLQHQKQKWKIQKQARARRRQLFGERPNVATDSISSFFRSQAEMLYINTWHVLQLRQGESPGEVTAFVAIGKKIHALNIKVPRTLYLNLKGDELPNVEVPGCEVEKVNHVLPNGHPSVHLFQLTMPEDTYLREAESVSLLCNHASVEGVYERQLPLFMRAMLKLGNMCSFDETQKGVLGKGLEQGFDLSALLRSNSQSTYLEDPSSFGYIYVYHVAAGDRNVFAMFSTSRSEAHIVVLSRGRDAQLPNADKIYTEQYRQKTAEQTLVETIFEYQPNLHFKLSQVTTRRKAHIEIGDVLKKWRSEESKPTMLLLQSTSHKQLVHDIRIMRDYPILSLPTDHADADLPPLGWQGYAFKQLISHYLNAHGWLAHLLELARYGDMPLCNLEKDDPRFLIDLAYARRLKKNNVVLWWSDQVRPDHAGHERDDVI
ncbi:DNA polymerase epsilon catalytic subunit, partial [Exophiala xenobiotica]